MNSLLNHPLVCVTTLGFLLAICGAVAAFKARGRLKRATLAAVAALCVMIPGYLLAAVFAPQWIDARHRVYKAFYDDIEAGMTRDQVIATLDHRYPEGGPRQRPTIIKDTVEELGFFMNPERSRGPNCEGIFLDFTEGRVVRKHYSRD